MKSNTTPTFILSLPIKIKPGQKRILNTRFTMARQVYNAALGESMDRVKRMRATKVYQQAKVMSRGQKKVKLPKKPSEADKVRKKKLEVEYKVRSKAFGDVYNKFGYYPNLKNNYLAYPSNYLAKANTKGKKIKYFSSSFTGSDIGNHLGTRVINNLVNQAAQAVTRWGGEPYYFNKKKGRPRFKVRNKHFITSVRGGGEKFGPSGIRWVSDSLVIWNGLELETIRGFDNPIVTHGLSKRIKYASIVRKKIRGEWRYYTQLACEGRPFQRYDSKSGVVGLDLGPSSIAVVVPNGESSMASLEQFCQQLDNIRPEIAKLQRAIDRQRRANNPHKYEKNTFAIAVTRRKRRPIPSGRVVRKRGKNKKGNKQPWNELSKRQLANEIELQELHRKAAEYRKCLHGALVNRIIQLGDSVKLEKIVYKSWQKMWGRSAGRNAPGMFVEKLRQKAASGVIEIEEVSTYNTRLSQIDHKTGELKKKELKERWHYFDDGQVVQRDLYSAFLVACVEDGEMILEIAESEWGKMYPILVQVIEDLRNDDNSYPKSFGI